MITNVRDVGVPAAKVWDVLADGWLYPVWVVGASRMRQVDAGWPEKGARLHHSVGVWPVLIDDYTEVTETVPGTLLALRARAWPFGEAAVRLVVEEAGDGSRVRIEEQIVRGPGSLIPRPLRGVLLKWRNVETLRRLALVAEGR
ncbi:MAG TPA: SRPBCC family protein [Nocardioides sp.]|uniref:SRPBCC family protein n=1 Tax=Nocardioides sp. TaxID=35761 RepID=UPI002EDB16BF